MRVDRLLLDDERPLIETRRHPVVLFRPLMAAAAAIVIALVLGAVVTPNDTRDAFDLVVGVAAIAVCARAIWKVASWRVDTVVLTDRRVITARGLVTRHVGSIPLSRVTDLAVQRSALGGLLGYAHFIVESGGARAGRYHLHHLPRYTEVRRALSHATARGGGPALVREATPADEADTGPLPRVIV
ncbi:MAG TPA: PH domain-containing protein [Actinomycetota bacterium]|nr:PH domain-containing protein [Actinomycetota bacterium]